MCRLHLFVLDSHLATLWESKCPFGFLLVMFPLGSSNFVLVFLSLGCLWWEVWDNSIDSWSLPSLLFWQFSCQSHTILYVTLDTKLISNFTAVRAFLCTIASRSHFDIPQFKSMERLSQSLNSLVAWFHLFFWGACLFTWTLCHWFNTFKTVLRRGYEDLIFPGVHKKALSLCTVASFKNFFSLN